jgi:HAD superfamily hydrolase (TIGR01484 family)
MRFYALACDYDGTLAHYGRVDEPTVAALERLLETGRRLILVTGRELPELQQIFPQLNLFAWVVAENGALLYCPGSREEKLLASAPPPALIESIKRRGVAPFSVGRAIVATWHPHEVTVLECIRELGLEYQVIFNKDAVMVLPSGVNKATGLLAALDEMHLSPHEVAGVGDAENDHAFLSLCECSVAVDNALPSVKERVDVVARADHGAGVVELIDELVKSDLAAWEQRLSRHHLRLGTRRDGAAVALPPYGLSLLIAGPSGSGKSTVATSLLERLTERHYQFCIIDPEGDYEGLPDVLVVGSTQRGPTATEVIQHLQTSRGNLVVNLVGMPLADRPPFFLALLPQLQEVRARTGRPHWVVVDEAHHLLPASWGPGPLVMPEGLKRVLFITVHPGQVAKSALASVGAVLAVGPGPDKTLADFAAAVGEPPPLSEGDVAQGEIYLWTRGAEIAPGPIRMAPSRLERRRHVRKYAEGELPPERSFYFKGPEGKLNLRAQNLILFMQMAEGVDDLTWMHHLRRGDYSQWFRDRIKDETLGDEAAAIEQQSQLSPQESRAALRSLIEKYYTLPAAPPLPMPGTDAAPRGEKEAEAAEERRQKSTLD